MAEQNKISIIIQAVDRATATVKAINGTIAKMAAPARATSRSLGNLVTATGYKRVEKAVDGVGKSLLGIATTGAVVTGALGGMFYALTRITNAGESATKAAQSFGTTVPEWQKLAYAAYVADVSTEDLGQSLGVLNKRALAAATGNQESAIWFRRAGISVRDQNGHVKSSTQLMGELADVFEKMPDGPKKLALANGLLKDSQGKLIPLLNGGSKGLREAGAEAEAYGLVSEQLARDGALFNDELKKTRAAATGVGNAIGVAILPAINELMPGLRAWIVSNRELVAVTAKDLFQGLKDIGAVILDVLRAVNAVVQVFGGWKTVVYVLAGFIGAKMVFAVLALAKSFFVLGAAILTTPIGWIAAGIAVLAAGAYLLIKNWTAVKEFFVDLIDTVFSPLVKLMETLSSLVPKTSGQFGTSFNHALAGIGPPAASALGPGGGSRGGTQQIGGTLNIKWDGPGRIAKQESFGGLNLEVDSGYASAGMGY
jgi:hypothetical protein